ncbi:hypothetical protein [Gimibacter soli]|uniref:Lipoprotein n=1 Tax=Gimibacter soli TaxID=3024400 RepID=A0AAE9XXK0_9PROT|nr:hypothetical protein [Gimibacter soli]WCL55524.1 hypothetical protein PH603_07090 [Gimibacter soli]
MHRHFLILPLALAAAACSVSYEARVERYNAHQLSLFDACLAAPIGHEDIARAEASIPYSSADGKCSYSYAHRRPDDGRYCEAHQFRKIPDLPIKQCEDQLDQALKR